MAATKIILKRSSILGKRPSKSVIEAGEIALNTNSDEPGLFFEVDNGDVVKVGPSSVMAVRPLNEPEKGESWFNTANGTFSIGTVADAKKVWRSIAAPFLGGGGRVVFVAPEFPYSTDSFSNQGQALPFQTLTRAILELSKQAVLDSLTGEVSSEADRSTIYFAPSRLTANNEPGVELNELTVGPDGKGFPNSNYVPSINELTQFNPPETGGVLLPRGISIVGMDLKKCEMHPTYVPTYEHPVPTVFPSVHNQPLSSVIKWTGNCYLEEFSALDKVDIRQVYKITPLSETSGAAVFHTTRPHGLSNNDRVNVSYESTADQSVRTFANGIYFARVLDTFTFTLTEDPTQLEPLLIQYSSLVPEGQSSFQRLLVTNELYSAHRLKVWQSATFDELTLYYEKVQRAFPETFGGRVVDGANIVSVGEYEIVAPTNEGYPNNFATNSVKNSSAYANQVNLRSGYGMCGGEINGETVEGFRSAIVNACTVASIQTDPAAYEVYGVIPVTVPGSETVEFVEKWWSLIEFAYNSIPPNSRPSTLEKTPRSVQLKVLNETSIENIRYYYATLKATNGKSIGITDVENDFRHFAFRALNDSYIQAQSIYTIGCAVGTWALNGGYISLTNSTSNFGSVAFKSEGFRGINTKGGAFANAQGFSFSGINTPLALNKTQAEDDSNKAILSLGSRVVDVSYEPGNSVQLVTLGGAFLPCYILPFSLAPGSALWVSTPDCTYRGFFATDGGPTIIFNSGICPTVTLRIRSSDSTIPSDPSIISNLDIPYIRRFHDPRNATDRAYSIVVQNTSQTALAPYTGSVLRLNQTQAGAFSTSIKSGFQFDPGNFGGWGRVLTVDNVATEVRALSPNFNYVVGDSTQAQRYQITLTVSDYGKPWQQEENNAQGDYVTYKNRNWYAAENNSWDNLYYGQISNSFGPIKLTPSSECSPFVTTSVLEKQDIVGETYQGVLGDPMSGNAEYQQLSYYRGSTLPYTEFGAQNFYDYDDGSESTGLILKRRTLGGAVTIVSEISPANPNSIVQTPQAPSAAAGLRYRPEIVRFTVLSASNIPNPKQTVSIIKLAKNAKVEYFQVVNLVGNTVEAIRLDSLNSFYPDPTGGTPPEKPRWYPGDTGFVCVSDLEPEVEIYDPMWSNTKKAIFRFLELMGYSKNALQNGQKKLQPYYWGERFYSYADLPSTPDLEEGYANATAQWPLEFNQPSTVIANTHTWSFCGYPFYSRGLPRYQTNEISRKLSYDFLSTTLWGGRLTVTGINDKGELISFGPQREAVTAQYYEQESPVISAAGQQLYEEQPYVEFPDQVLVYSTDSLTPEFDGQQIYFELKKGGVAIPASQLSAESVFVQLGAVTQKPGEDYTLIGNTIQFTSAPATNSLCDVRVVTSEDNNKTLSVVTLVPQEEIDGTRAVFTLTSPSNLEGLDISMKNTFVFLGGIEQIPESAYFLSKDSETQYTIAFTEILPEGVILDIRVVCAGTYWGYRGVNPVAVYSLDSISSQFDDNTQAKVFDLTYDNKPINPSIATTENVFVAVGGVMQMPYESYTISNGQITFTEAPQFGSSSNLRIVTNAEFLPCLSGNGFTEGFVNWGPSVVLDLAAQVKEIEDEIKDLQGN